MEKQRVYLVAAGTGGHINAAKSLGAFYNSQNYEVVHITGQRALDKRLLKGNNVYHLRSESIRNRSFIKKILSLLNNFIVFYQSVSLMSKSRPNLVIGAGGYICGPVLMAAFFLSIPFSILEQNSVVGMTNKILAFFAHRVFVNFKNTNFPYFIRYKISVVGNPVRKGLRNSPVHSKKDYLNLLVIGGSLGALEINDLFKKFIESDQYQDSLKVNIRHQTGLGKGFEVDKKVYNYEQFEYIDDMETEYKWANLIFCRSGASTLSELRYLQIPSVLIPYPYATDNHQEINALSFQQESHFPVFVYKTKELARDNFKLLLEIIDDSRNCEIKYIDYGREKTTEELIFRECNNDI